MTIRTKGGWIIIDTVQKVGNTTTHRFYGIPGWYLLALAAAAFCILIVIWWCRASNKSN